MAITGTEGVGKSRFLEEMMGQWGGTLVDPGRPDQIDPAAQGPWAVDDAHRATPIELFTVINQAIADRRPLLLSGEGRPALWVSDPTAPGAPDLSSRLNAVPAVALDAPDAETMEKALMLALHGVGLHLPEAAVRHAVAQLYRRFTVIEPIVRSAVRISPSIAAPKPLLDAAIADNPEHCLT
ncbi:MAG: hypothetical protein AAGA69_05710 [Pseudomonadota bacterium]